MCTLNDPHKFIRAEIDKETIVGLGQFKGFSRAREVHIKQTCFLETALGASYTLCVNCPDVSEKEFIEPYENPVDWITITALGLIRCRMWEAI